MTPTCRCCGGTAGELAAGHNGDHYHRRYVDCVDALRDAVERERAAHAATRAAAATFVEAVRAEFPGLAPWGAIRRALVAYDASMSEAAR